MQILVKTWRGKAAVPQLVEDGHGSESVLFGLCASLHVLAALIFCHFTYYHGASFVFFSCTLIVLFIKHFFWHFLSLVIKTMRFNTGFIRWVGNITASVPNYSDCLQNSQTCQWLDALAGAFVVTLADVFWRGSFPFFSLVRAPNPNVIFYQIHLIVEQKQSCLLPSISIFVWCTVMLWHKFSWEPFFSPPPSS